MRISPSREILKWIVAGFLVYKMVTAPNEEIKAIYMVAMMLIAWHALTMTRNVAIYMKKEDHATPQ